MTAISKTDPAFSLVARIGSTRATFHPSETLISLGDDLGALSLTSDTWAQIVAASAVYDAILAGHPVPAHDAAPISIASQEIPALGSPMTGGFYGGHDPEEPGYHLLLADIEFSARNLDWNAAMKHCADCRAGGFDDWEAPTDLQAIALYHRLGQSVTKVDAFKAGGAQAFPEVSHWTCCEVVSGGARLVNFGAGHSGWDGKYYSFAVRPVRKFCTTDLAS